MSATIKTSLTKFNTLPEGYGFKKRNEIFSGGNYSFYYEIMNYDKSKYFKLTSNDLRPAFSGIPHKLPEHLYDKQWLNNALQIKYKNDDESDFALLDELQSLETLAKDTFSKNYFCNVITSVLKPKTFNDPMYQMDPEGYWFSKCNYRPFETKEFMELTESGVFNNLKVKICGLKKKVELNGKEGVIMGYKDERFIVKIEGKKYLLNQININYNENYLMGEQTTLFGEKVKKVKRKNITYPTVITFRLSTAKDNWNTVYKNTCRGEFMERDDDVLRQMLQDYKFSVKFTPRIYYRIINYRIFVNIELLLLELNFLEKIPKKISEVKFLNYEGRVEDIEIEDTDTEDED